MNFTLQHLTECSSTNSVLKQMLPDNPPEGTVIWADTQTHGRGRTGHSFSSPKGGLYFSLLLKPANQNFSTGKLDFSVTLLTTLTAVCLAQAIEEEASDCDAKDLFPVKIKWVNDLYLGGKKIAGILTESVIQGSEISVILGIGVNVQTPAEGFEPEISDIACSLYHHDISENKKKALLDRFLTIFDHLYPSLPNTAYLDEYRSRLCLIGQKVSFLNRDHQKTTALVTGIGPLGSLCVTTCDATAKSLELFEGEVSIIRPEGDAESN